MKINSSQRMALVMGGVIFMTVVIVASIGWSLLADGLPSKRPADMHIYVSISYGMVPGGSSVFISEQESYARVFTHNNLTNQIVETKTTFTVTPDELDTLYAVFKKRKFPRIKETPTEVYDAGGTSISISSIDHDFSINKSDISGNSSITEKKSLQRFEAAYNAINSLVAGKIAASAPAPAIK